MITVYNVFNEDGTKVCQTGNLKDAELMVSFVPHRYYLPVELPPPPPVVNVSYTEGEREKQLNPQNVLPESEQEPLNMV